jgi:LmbE family N-acetylglucosaminyl deacetylase
MRWFLFLMTGVLMAQQPQPKPDARFKADILVIVAHPDDEGMAIGYLAKAVLDLHKRVAVVYGTRGDGGGNAIGMEQAASLGAEREMEARRADATVGITNVWFLGAPDTPGQNVLRSLETWNHGASVGQVVRLVRLTRPEVIMTWMPAYSAGENHGDHQAASVLANEAFDLAGDPTAFPEQVTPPRDHAASGTLTEGLHPWQPKKLYFFSDATNTAALEGHGPQYPWSEVSPSQKVTYGRLALESIAKHETQDYPGQMAAAALKQSDLGALKDMKTRLVLGKTLVGGTVTGDVFAGITDAPVAYQRVPGYEAEVRSGLSAELGGPWAFYKQFWKAHALMQVQELFNPQVQVPASSEVYVPVLLHNETGGDVSFEVSAEAPAGWGAAVGVGKYLVAAHETVSADVSVPTPAKSESAQKVRVNVTGPSGRVAQLGVDVTVVLDGLQQH